MGSEDHISRLEAIFQRVANTPGPTGCCPLREPGKGAPPPEHPHLMSVRKQPPGFDYDTPDNEAEAKRFRKDVQKLAKTDSRVRA